MVWSRIGAVAALSLSLLAVPPAAAQATEYLLLGEDATGDAELNGVPMLDTWVDINHLAVATVGTDLVFHLGLEGTTTEAGQYCWMAAFEFDGTEYVGLDCYEGLAYESDNTISGVRPASTSRGTNVASSVVFDDTGAVITIPLASIGAALGDTIEDVYGLTYATRGLVAVDTVPDAKMTANADESLGSYVIGGGSGADAPAVVHETLNGTSFAHAFPEPTSTTYVLNLTVPWANATVSLVTNATAGAANVTVTRGNETLLSFAVDNTTTNATSALTGAAGNWTITVTYSGFAGNLSLDVTQTAATTAATPLKPSSVGTGTATTSSSAAQDEDTTAGDELEQDAPALGPALLVLALAAVALARRRLS